MKTKFEYEKVRFDRVSVGKTDGKVKLIETEGFLVKDLGIDYIELIVHRTPYTKDKWLVSDRTSGYRINAIACDTTKNDAVVQALTIFNSLGQTQVETFVEEKRAWTEYYKGRVPTVSIKQDTR